MFWNNFQLPHKANNLNGERNKKYMYKYNDKLVNFLQVPEKRGVEKFDKNFLVQLIIHKLTCSIKRGWGDKCGYGARAANRKLILVLCSLALCTHERLHNHLSSSPTNVHPSILCLRRSIIVIVGMM
jgi:hypothetical protein